MGEWALCIILVTLGSVSVVFGEAVFGTDDYTEYDPGDVNSRLILSAPHGGAVIPDAIPTRQDGCWDGSNCNWDHECGTADTSNCDATITKDLYTQEIARLLQTALATGLGSKPHLVVCHLHRRKVDVNREVGEGAQGNPTATTVWQEYHEFLAHAKANLSGPGLILDLHGQAHSEAWVELGYTISGNNLDNGIPEADASSIRSLAGSVEGVSFENLLRGDQSLGYYLQQRGYTTVPSPANNGPDDGNYFSGGYITKQYGSRDGGTLDAIQVEMPSVVRNAEDAPAFVEALAASVKLFMQHYGDENVETSTPEEITQTTAATNEEETTVGGEGGEEETTQTTPATTTTTPTTTTTTAATTTTAGGTFTDGGDGSEEDTTGAMGSVTMVTEDDVTTDVGNATDVDAAESTTAADESKASMMSFTWWATVACWVTAMLGMG